ncbi:MAG: hypothetical protein SFY95_02835 [Planctomycetota bacterium]|nr:hypothetical protein [Planctomycetota bacterium]
MTQTVIKWATGLLALFLIGPLASVPLSNLRLPEGSTAATALWSTAPAAGLLGVVIVLVVALVYGLVALRVAGGPTAVLAMGMILGWGAYRMPVVEEALRRTVATGSSPSALLWSQAVEGAIVGALLIAVAAIFEAAHARLASTHEGSPAWIRKELLSKEGLIGIAVAMVLAGVAAGIVAFDSARGQALAAGWLGAIAAGAAARLTHASAGHRFPILGPVAGIALAGVIVPIVAAIMHGARVGELAYAQQLFAPARLTPLDWAAGAMLGVPTGIAWAGGMIEKRSAQPAA